MNINCARIVVLLKRMKILSDWRVFEKLFAGCTDSRKLSSYLYMMRPTTLLSSKQLFINIAIGKWLSRSGTQYQMENRLNARDKIYGEIKDGFVLIFFFKLYSNWPLQQVPIHRCESAKTENNRDTVECITNDCQRFLTTLNGFVDINVTVSQTV